MIEPNMATMLVYIFTDAAISTPPTLDRLLREAVDVSFNMLSVDSDTSTSDTCAILANGLAGAVDAHAFREALTAGCIRMTEILARDGEGATQAAARDGARALRRLPKHAVIAKSIVNSPLVKTMVSRRRPERRPHPHGRRQVLRLHDSTGRDGRVDQRAEGRECRRANDVR